MRAAELLEEHGISSEVIDLRCLRPLDYETLVQSVRKTGRVLIADHGNVMAGISAEISSLLTEQLYGQLHFAPIRVGLPDHPTPTSPTLADKYYPQAYQLANHCLELMKRRERQEPPILSRRLDQPDASFQGPF
jgi:pyruvate dehydrogenase E1 component beta subunit